MIRWYHLIFAYIIGMSVGYFFISKPTVDTTQLKELEKNAAYQHLRAQQARDSAKMFLKAIDEISNRISKRDSATDTQIKYETVILHHYDNAPSVKLDSFLRARYPDSITVARRSNR